MKKKIKHLKWIMVTLLLFLHLKSTGQPTPEDLWLAFQGKKVSDWGCSDSDIFYFEYNQIVEELSSRAQIGKSADSPLASYESNCLLKMKHLLDALYEKGRSLKDLKDHVSINTASAFSLNTIPSLMDLDTSLTPEERFYVNVVNNADEDNDNRHLVEGESSPASIVALAENGTIVLVMPKTKKYGRRQWFPFGYHPFRDEFYTDLPASSCSDCRFGNEHVLPLGTRTGINVQGKWIVTAGHGLKEGDKQCVLRDFWELPSPYDTVFSRPYYSYGEVVHVEYGSAHAPDFAIIELKPGFKKLGLSIEKLRRDAEIDSSTKLLVAGHPLGMNMIADINGNLMAYPAEHWKESPYFFANLDVNCGNSGSPVFVRDSYFTSKDTNNLKLVGIVVGSGGLKDFHCENGNCQWDAPTQEQAVGSRVLKMSVILPILERLMKVKSPAPQQDLTLIPTTALPYRAPVQAADLNNYTVTIKDKHLVFTRKNDGDSIPPLNLEQARLVKLDGCILNVYDGTLANIYATPSAPVANNRLTTSTTMFSLGIFKENHHGLQFRCKDARKDMLETFGLPNPSYNLLEGVGSVDIIDELPRSGEFDQWLLWLCDGEYLEFSIAEFQAPFPGTPDEPLSRALYEKVLMVRSVYPFVPTYLRLKEKQP